MLNRTPFKTKRIFDTRFFFLQKKTLTLTRKCILKRQQINLLNNKYFLILKYLHDCGSFLYTKNIYGYQLSTIKWFSCGFFDLELPLYRTLMIDHNNGNVQR